MKRSRSLSLSVALPLGLVALGSLLARPERSLPAAEAKPEYAAKEKKDCLFCHTNPKGGGPRNSVGAEYEKNGHKFPPKPAGGFGEDKAFASEANGKAFALVRRAVEIGHWSDAYRRIDALQTKERKGPGAQLLMNTEAQVDGRGRDLVKAAKDAMVAGKTQEAAEAIARLEVEFKGRGASKDVARLRADLVRMPGGKEADAAARPVQERRMKFLDALMKDAEGQRPLAVKACQELLQKGADAPFSADAKKMLEEWGAPTEAAPPAPAK
jgi:hypothetical protein